MPHILPQFGVIPPPQLVFQGQRASVAFLLGRGATAMVYECELSLDGQTQHAAAKVLSMLEDVNSASPGTAASGASSLLQHEAEMLQGLSDVDGVARLVGQLDGGRVLLLQPVGESLAAGRQWRR